MKNIPSIFTHFQQLGVTPVLERNSSETLLCVANRPGQQSDEI